MEGEVFTLDPRFSYTLDSLPEFNVDLDKMRYDLPTRTDLYKEKLTGFSDLALDIIEMWENKASNNDFKRKMKRLHAEGKLRFPSTPSY